MYITLHTVPATYACSPSGNTKPSGTLGVSVATAHKRESSTWTWARTGTLCKGQGLSYGLWLNLGAVLAKRAALCFPNIGSFGTMQGEKLLALEEKPNCTWQSLCCWGCTGPCPSTGTERRRQPTPVHRHRCLTGRRDWRFFSQRALPIKAKPY